MIVPDVNLLIYAYDETSPHHTAAAAWWERAIRGAEPVGIPSGVVLAFVRLVTHPTLVDNPMTPGQARKHVETWLAFDHVRLLSPGASTLNHFFDLLDAAGTGGNLTTDAMIAAVANEHGGCVYSNDRDFDRFTGLLWRNPLA